MYNGIIIMGVLYGSVYIFCKSLELINKLSIENRESKRINGITFVISGCIFVYGVKSVLYR